MAKKPVTERTVQEDREHVLRIDPIALALFSLLLSLAIAYVNSSI